MQTMYLKRKAMMARGYKGKSSMKTPFGRTRDTDRALQQHSDSEDDTDAEAEYEVQKLVQNIFSFGTKYK